MPEKSISSHPQHEELLKMDRWKRKLFPWEIRDLLLAEDGYEVRKAHEFKYPQSKHRAWVNSIKTIIKHFPFSKKQEMLLGAFGKKQHLDSLDIKIATGSKQPTALIRDIRKKIKSIQHLKEIVAIKSYRHGQKWIYNLTIIGLED